MDVVYIQIQQLGQRRDGWIWGWKLESVGHPDVNANLECLKTWNALDIELTESKHQNCPGQPLSN